MSTRIYAKMQSCVLFHAALADENRLRLLSLMRAGEICVCQLQGVLQTNQPKISRHLAYLKRAGLVAARQDGRWTHYRLAPSSPGLGELLEHTLDHLQNHPQIAADRQRLELVTCQPTPAR